MEIIKNKMLVLQRDEDFHLKCEIYPNFMPFRSSVIACQSIGALCSFVLIAPLERKFGAKRTLTVFNNGVLLVASVLFGLISKYTSTILLLSIGRLLIGVYTGLSCALVPIYIQEVAPDHLKVHLFCLFIKIRGNLISIHIFLFKQIPQNEYTFLIILEFYSIEN